MSDSYLSDDTYETETPAETASTTSGSRRGGRRSSKLSAKDIARVVGVYDKLRSADDETLLVLASLTGARADVGDLTTAILTGKTASLDLVSSIMAWHSGSEMDATLGVYQLSENRAGLSPLWSILHSLGALDASNPSRNTVESVRAIVTAIRGLDSIQSATLSRVVEITN